MISAMRDHYDFSDSKPNPYAKRVERQVTSRLDEEMINFLKDKANRNGLPYKSSINLFLRGCAESNRDLRLG